MVQKVGNNQKVLKVVKISGKDDILTVEEIEISLIWNRTKDKPWNESMTKRVIGNTVEGGQDAD